MIKLNEEYKLSDIFNDPDNFTELLYLEGYQIYRIHNHVTDKSYIGDTISNLYYRFISSPRSHFNKYLDGNNNHLYNSMRLYGLDKFYLSLLYLGEYDDNLEEDFIDKYNSFENGYNNCKSGKPFHLRSAITGWKRIHNDQESLIVPPHKLSEYLEKGYVLGSGLSCTVGYRWIYDGNEYSRVHEDNLQGYLDNGWIQQSPLLGLINITDEVNILKIDPEELPYYESLGWRRGLPHYTWMHRGDENIHAKDEDIESYLDDGFEFGRSYQPNEGKVGLHNSERFIFVYPDEVEDYLKEGFELGIGNDWVEGTIWINKGESRTRIHEDDLPSYLELGWKLGFGEGTTTDSICINNGKIIKKVWESDLDGYLKEGWRLGASLNQVRVHIEDDPEEYWISTDNSQLIMKFAKYGSVLDDGTRLEDTEYYTSKYEYPSYCYTLQGQLLSKYWYQLKETGKLDLTN